MNRQKYLDVAKGIGILLVVLGHASLKNAYVISYIYSFHMPLFFIIAGMLLQITSASNRPYGSVVKGRLYSIMLPYLVFSIIYTLLDIILKDEYTLVNLKATICLQGSGPLWFLPTLFISELLFIAYLKYGGDKLGIIFSIITGSIGLFVPKAIQAATGIDILHTPNEYLSNIILVVFRSFTCLVFLTVGYISVTFISKLKSNYVSTIMGVLMMGINIPFCLFCHYIYKSNDGIWSGADMHNMNLGPSNCMFVLCALLGSIGLILICKGNENLFTKSGLNLIDKLIRFWGQNSLLIMVTHLNCKVLYAGNLFAMFMNPHITRAKEYVFLLNVLWVTMLIETIIILIVNKICPFIVGKKIRENK